jgi:hypothetical protein
MTSKRTKKHRRKGSGKTSLDPNVHQQNQPSVPGKFGVSEDLAQKALAAQAARKAAKAGPAPVPQEEPGRRDSDASTEAEEVSFQENPLQALKGRKAEPTVVKGTLGQKTPGISFFGVQRHTTQKEKGGRKSRRKTHKRKRSHRR